MNLEERFCDVGRGITLCYQTLGESDDQPMLLIAGLGQQLNCWPEDLCRALAARGFYVIRFDNRDVGRSTRADSAPPKPFQFVTRRFDPAQYTLSDMARDAVGLIAGLGLQDAHLVGTSMGGMIAQTVAAHYPDRVRTLTSMVSTTGARRAGRPALSTVRLMARRPSTDRESAIAAAVRIWSHISSRGFPFNEHEVRAVAGEAFDRGASPDGSARQLAAILKSGDRTDECRKIAAPTLVIHGDRDVMVNPSGARATARTIPGARLETIAGMGHDLPVGAWPTVLDLIAEHAHAHDRSLGPTITSNIEYL
jgi:pimeloyl-ACP methyl ester carboxylesterase